MRIPRSSRWFLLHHLVKSFKGIFGFGFVLNFPGFRSSAYVRKWVPWKCCNVLMELCSCSKTGESFGAKVGGGCSRCNFFVSDGCFEEGAVEEAEDA